MSMGDEAMGRAPANYLAAARQAWAQEALQHWHKSLAGFDGLVKSAATDSQRLEAHLGRARILARMGRAHDARQALEDARHIDPKVVQTVVP
ncbi:MAG TPA: hypothetical protein VG013_27055 [Gemmataceae bacterium]|jgi:hypothetical protein|nr:hypothetical protein [Gemmataceae bacterium]